MADNFISAYLEHTAPYESPGSFWKWSGYSTISSVIRDKGYLKNGDSFLFPNLYILFLAESSGHRKNRPVDLSEKLVNSLNKAGYNYKTISGRSSVQAMMDELARAETDPNTGKVIACNSATFFAPELSAGIVNDPEGLKILTDIYDFKENEYKNRLRTGHNFNLSKLVFSMLSASNPDMLVGLFDQSVIRGGFLARTLLVVPNEFRGSNSLLRIDYDKLKESLLRTTAHLKEIAKLSGEFKMEEAAIVEYEAWYDPFRQDYAKKKEVTGIVGRVHTHVFKVAMILAANDLSMCIKKCHIEKAIEECLSLLPNYSVYTMNNAKSEIGSVGGVVITELLAAEGYTMSRKMIIRARWQDIDLELLEKAILALEEAGFIKRHMYKDGEYYQLTKQCLDMVGVE